MVDEAVGQTEAHHGNREALVGEHLENRVAGAARQLALFRGDEEFVREVSRVLRKGGVFIVSTPNAPMSLTRNPWHVREYTAEELRQLLGSCFPGIEALGVFGNEQVAAYYEKNRRGVERITRFDPLDLQHRLPRWMLQIPYDLLNRLNRRKLLRENNDLTTSIRMEDYRLGLVAEGCYDLFFVATK